MNPVAMATTFSVSAFLSAVAMTLLVYGVVSFARPRFPGEPTDFRSLLRRWLDR